MKTRLIEAWETAANANSREAIGIDMVAAVRSGTVLVDGLHETIKAGVTRVWRRHDWLHKPQLVSYFGLGPDRHLEWFLPSAQTAAASRGGSRRLWCYPTKTPWSQPMTFSGPARGQAGVLLITKAGTRPPKNDPRVKANPSSFVPVLAPGADCGDALLATATMSATDPKRNVRTVYAGQLVPRDHPMVALHPHHFELPPVEV